MNLAKEVSPAAVLSLSWVVERKDYAGQLRSREKGPSGATYPGGRGLRACNAVLLKGAVAVEMSNQALGRGGGPTKVVRHAGVGDWDLRGLMSGRLVCNR